MLCCFMFHFSACTTLLKSAYCTVQVGSTVYIYIYIFYEHKAHTTVSAGAGAGAGAASRVSGLNSSHTFCRPCFCLAAVVRIQYDVYYGVYIFWFCTNLLLIFFFLIFFLILPLLLFARLKGETRDTCSAAAGTFLVEFGALSRLTGDASFETAARRAVGALWARRSSLGLVGGGVAGTTGRWKSDLASIGAGTDSFYEYLLKSSTLFGDEEMGGMFREAYAAVETHMVWRGWHVEVDMLKGDQARFWESFI